MLPSERGHKRWCKRFVAAAVTVFALSCSTTPAMASFCDTGTLHDYTKVLKHLPKPPAPPLRGQLGFAPSGVLLSSFGSGLLQLGPGERGFSLSFSTRKGGHLSPRLDWQVSSRLIEIDRRGRPLGTPETVERKVKRLRPVEDGDLRFIFAVPGRPALYRLEIVFENAKGERLGRFGEDFRVLRPHLDVGLTLNATSFHRGETVQAWLLNRSAAFLFFGLARGIEYNDGTAWTRPPVEFPHGPVPEIGLNLGPGEKASCWKVTIPVDAALGTYRFIERLDYFYSSFKPRRPLEASAEFTVTE
ncbi:MAG: hypothetical protein ACTHKT_01735 [Solirubrobacterales bacterium]